jgi:hypothetical protein
MATLSFSNIGTTSLTAKVSGLDTNFAYNRRFEWFAGSVTKGYSYTSPGASSVSKSISGLSPGTKYAIIVDIYNDDLNTYLTTLYEYVTTNSIPKVPTPSLDTSKTIKTANSISVTTNLFSQADYYYFRINGGAIIDNGLNRTYNFTGLSPNTEYYIQIKIGADGYEDSDWVGYYATTLAAELWEWWTPKDNEDSDISPDEWLAFCEKINEIRVANGLSEYSFTTSSTYIGKDKPFYAWIWLQAANAINEINGQVAADCLNVKSFLESMNNDSIIYPWYWYNLKTALNNAIN